MRAPAYRILCLTLLLAFAACGEKTSSPTQPSRMAWMDLSPKMLVTIAANATMDIKPGSCPNPINPLSMGSFPVALAGRGAVDASVFDPSSIRLEGVAPSRYAIEDVTAPGGCCDLTAVHRVNAGGSLVPDFPDWAQDTTTGPSPFVNTGFTASTTDVFDLSHPSVPAGTPMDLFQSERWDWTVDPAMQWEFPVAAGEYIVRLYLAESYPPAMIVGGRRFDVQIEGNLVLDDYDIFAEVGGLKAVVKEFAATVTDGAVSVAFGHVVENPKINAIEILTRGGAPQPDGIDDLTLKFSTQDLVAALGPLSAGDQRELTITGMLFDGTPFSDTDCVVVVRAPAE